MYLTIALVCVVAVKNGMGQSYSHPFYMGGQYNSVLGQYQAFPFSSFPGGNRGGGGGNRNGRLVQMMKGSNFPSQFYDTEDSRSIPTAALTSSSSSSATSLQPSSFYSGFYYIQNKPSRGPQPSQSAPNLPSPAAYTSSLYGHESPPHHSSYSEMTPAHLHSIVLGEPSSSLPPPQTHFLRFPSTPSPSPRPTASASMDTYREALDLFSEVVTKLERETGNNNYHSSPPPPQFAHHSSLMANGIYGSSLPTGSPGGFPRHLDQIMGPDFLQKAQKLYTKIIEEQNKRIVATSPSPSQKYSTYYPGAKNSIHNLGSGFPYYESLVQSAPTNVPYSRPSYLARNMNIDPFMHSGIVDAVKSIEIPVGRRDDLDNSGETMQTSEFVQRPMFSHMNLNQVSVIPPLNYQHQQHLSHVSSSPPSVPEIPEVPTMLPQAYHQVNPEPTVPVPPIEIPRRIPLSENDYVEHPLPYEEYVGLVRDIAINHNY